MANPRLTVEAPVTAPGSWPAGILAYTENVHDVTRPTGVEYLAEVTCGPAGFAPGLCAPVAPIDPDDTKSFGEVGFPVGADPFVVYRGVECYLDASDDYTAIARRALEGGESYAVESAVFTLILDEVTETVGTGTVIQVLSALEAYAAQNIAEQPYLHVNLLGLNSLVKEGLVIRQADGTLQTYAGTKVVAGGGYGLTEATATTFDAFITGPVHLWRADYLLNRAVNIVTNLQRALAERVYTVTTACPPARGTATVPATTQEP